MITTHPSRQSIVWCDTDTCPAGLHAPSTNHDTARAVAAQYGWTHTGGQDPCPRCSRERVPGNSSSLLMGFNHDATPTDGHDQDPLERAQTQAEALARVVESRETRSMIKDAPRAIQRHTRKGATETVREARIKGRLARPQRRTCGNFLDLAPGNGCHESGMTPKLEP